MKRIAASVAGVALGLGGTVAMAAPAQAQPNIGAHNLVNVQISNLLNNNQVAVQVPINVVANVCLSDVTVAAIAEVIDSGSPFTCTANGGNRELTVTR